MPDSFQSTSHQEANYHRPNQGWTCGGDCHDCPCYLGPDRKGRCQAGKELDGRRSGQCLPRKHGERWMCTRQGIHGVTPCEQGPLPDGSCCQSVPKCQPRRSVRKQRGLFAFAVSIITIAVIILTFSKGSGDGDDPPPSLSAGPLSPNHSFIETHCSACHSEQRLTLSRLTEFHASATQHRAIEDGKLCIACHDAVGGKDGQFAFAPHTAEQLGKRWKGQGKSSDFMMIAASALLAQSLHQGSIQCATCHQEHHGADIDITAMSNRQCQVCHSNQFESFSNGHPEFREITYPYRRRTGIRFDHYSHYQTHFQDDQVLPEWLPKGFDPAHKHEESESCTTCHETESSGEGMIVKSFEASCANCHEESTRGGNSIPFLAFPNLNTALLDEKLATNDPKRSIGTWIKDAPESIPWATLQLLPSDAREAWGSLRERKIDPFDPALADLDAESVAQVERLAWAVKALARDLSQSSPNENPSNRVGHDELVLRFRNSGFKNPELLISGLPPGLLDSMRRGFSEENYIRLLDEVDGYRKGIFPKAVPAAPPGPTSTPQTTPSEEPETFGDDAEESFGNETDESFGDDAEESFGDGEEEAFGLEEEPSDLDEASEGKELPVIDPTVWATHGGWYQQYGVVSYRSTGHADPLLKHWLDELVRRIDDPLTRAHLAEGFDFRSGSASSASGQCFKCHSVDEIRDADDHLTGARINWRSLVSSAPRESFTHYDHSTHLLLMDCRSCHHTGKGAAEKGYLNFYPGVEDWDASVNWSEKADPSHFQSSFSAIRKDTCATCHNPAKAGDHCTQCHQYHKSSR